MSKTEDEELLALANAVKGRQVSMEGPRERLTILVSTLLKRRLQLVYGKTLGHKFEEEMLARLIREGHLGTKIESGGGADAYFNPKTKAEGRETPKAKPKAVKGKRPVWDPANKTMDLVDDDEE